MAVDSTAKLTILAELRDQASDAMRRMGDVANDLGGAFGFAGDKSGILAGSLAAIGGSAVLAGLNAFNSAQAKLDAAQGIFSQLPDGINKFRQAIEAGSKAQQQFGFDGEEATLAIARFANAAGGDMMKALQAFQASMGLAVDKFGGPDGLESAVAALLPTFSGGSRAVKALGFDIDEHASVQTAFQKVIDATTGRLDAFGRSAEGQKAILKANLGDALENLGEPFGKTQGFLTTFINKNLDMQRVIEQGKPFIEGIGISLAGVSTVLAVRAIPQILTTVAGFLGLSEAVTVLGASLTVSLGIWALIVVGIGLVIGAIILMVQHWDQVKEFLKQTWETIKNMFFTIWDAILDWLTHFPEKVGAILGTLVVIFVKGFTALGEYLGQVVPQIITNLVNWFATIPSRIVSSLNSLPSMLVNLFTQAADNIRSVISGVISYVSSAPGSIVDFGKGAINGFIDVVNRFVGSFNSVAGKVGLSLPTIPKFAEGGIVTGPTIGLIGEAGPEAVIPLSKAGSFGLNGGGINIILQGDFYTDAEVAERFGNKLAFIIKNQLNLAGIRA